MHKWERFEMMPGDGPGVYPEQASDGDWVRVEDAIKREAELLDQIKQLEQRATMAAELVSKAVGIMAPATKEK
jgi:hypothetical protein